MKHWCVLAVTIALGFTACTTQESNPEAEAAAVKVAKTWVALIDEGKYDESYDASATFMRNAVKKEQSSAAIKAAREPLGEVVSREVKSKTYMTSVPGGPDGEYVVVQFNTSFKNKKKAVETITPMKDNGEWKVSGYYIK